ncbi:MAG: hypothetical protein V7K21_14030 [Nostoc sp.]|uniref:hypothetical protein n=1 Tax=Nostoc sp. TaxID=1180 RepID=UPI002FF5D7F3
MLLLQLRRPIVRTSLQDAALNSRSVTTANIAAAANNSAQAVELKLTGKVMLRCIAVFFSANSFKYEATQEASVEKLMPLNYSKK